MKVRNYLFASRLLAALFVASLLGTSHAAETTGPLAEYVAKPDSSYKWVKRQERDLAGVKFVELTLTSQTWKTGPWKHQLFIIRPAEIPESSHALILISGGAWKDELEAPPQEGDALPGEAPVLAQAVKMLKAPVALLCQVPNQPIMGGLTEDEAISQSFVEFLNSGDKEWPLLLPMTKSAVKAMDAVQEFAKQEWQRDIKSFTVTGASKRGWTTWLTGAVDPRATAIAPIVIDTLNMRAQMPHQLKSWGKYSEQIEDYTRRGIQQQANTPRGIELDGIVDPYHYRAEITQPKLLIMGTNDRYWALDALNLYWPDLQGEKRILYVPNNGHGVNDFARILGSIGALHKQAAGELELPKLTWEFQDGADQVSLLIKSDKAPHKVDIWSATAPTRDFRDSKWTSQPATSAGGEFRFDYKAPAEGFAAFFGEAVYREGGAPFFFSTTLRIVEPAGEKTAGK